MTTRRTRQTVASLASLLVSGALLRVDLQTAHGRSDALLIGMVVTAPFAAAILIWIRRLPAQLLARGTWWSYLLTSTLLTCVNETAPRHLGGLTAGASALALLAAGREGLDEGTGRFQPVAFRGTLTVALVLAMADTGALLWIGLVEVLHSDFRVILLVPLMAVGVVGLLRLRMWGLLAGLAANVLVATLAATGALGLPDPLRGLFIGTASLQLVVPLPMLVAIVRRRPPSTEHGPRANRVVVPAAIVAIAAFALYSGLVGRHPLIAF